MALWTPAEITTQLWLDASDASTLSLVSSAVSEWRDKSGNGYHVSQGTAGYRPTRVSAFQNGLDVVRFDGTDDRLARTAATNLGRNTPAYHLFVVRRHAALGSVLRIAAAFGTGSGSFRARVGANNAGSGVSYALARRGDADSGVSLSGGAVTLGAWGIQGLSADLPTSSATLYKNGVAEHSVTIPGSGNTSDTTSAALCVGAYETGTLFYFWGEIAEVVVAHTLGAGIREKIEGYLAHRWGLAGLLPAGHPYKSAAPTTGSTNYDLTIAATSSLSEAANAVLTATSNYSLTAGNLSSVSEISTPTLSSGSALVAGNAESAGALDGASLSAQYALNAAALSSAGALSGISLSAAVELAAQAISVASMLDHLQLDAGVSITPHALSSASELGAISLSADHALAVYPAQSSAVLDHLAFASSAALTLHDLVSTSTAKHITLFDDQVLRTGHMASATASAHAQLSASVALLVHDLLSGAEIDAAPLASALGLSVANLTSETLADTLRLFFPRADADLLARSVFLRLVEQGAVVTINDIYATIKFTDVCETLRVARPEATVRY